MVGNGDWNEMQKLVISKMDEHTKKLDNLQINVAELKTEVAIITDREDRELIAARGVAIRWSTGIGIVVSSAISGLIGSIRGE
jgi:predicted neutral ceramidase superfamily lipid hydrolase